MNNYNNTNQGHDEEQATIPYIDVELLIPAHNQVGSIYNSQLSIMDRFFYLFK
jgi:hypothetical protein